MTDNAAPPEPKLETELVVVSFKDFDSPREAYEYGGQGFTYKADKKLKLTIGDRVIVPVGYHNYHKVATVVDFTEVRPGPPLKQVVRKTA